MNCNEWCLIPRPDLKTPLVPVIIALFTVKSVLDNIDALTASSKDQIASWDESTGLSLFTKYFLLGEAGLADQFPVGNGDGVISEQELMTYVEQEVRVQAQRLYDREQSPQFRFASAR